MGRHRRRYGLRCRPPKAGLGQQFRDLGFSPAEQDAANDAFSAWRKRLAVAPPPSDCAGDALELGGAWNAYLQAMSGYISGAALERISAADHLAYDEASTRHSGRLPAGYGTLVAGSRPATIALRLATPVEVVDLTAAGVSITTRSGSITARAAIVAVSTDVLVTGTFRLTSAPMIGVMPLPACRSGETRSCSWRS
jgi:monoamine oxidase